MWFYVVRLWVNGAMGKVLGWAVPCTGGTRDRPKIYLAAILGGSERRPYEFFFYIVPLWVNSANGKVLGRLKRRPYNFSFHVVPL